MKTSFGRTRKADCVPVRSCRACGAGGLRPVIDLGRQPLANALERARRTPGKRYPLTLMFCQRCSLVQLRQTVRKEILFDRYVWLTRTSVTARRYARQFFERVRARTGLKRGGTVYEIASNDGTFLLPFVKNGYRALGIEPAHNVARLAARAGVPTLCAYWDRDTSARTLERTGPAQVIIARNVIPHVSDLHGVLDGIAIALAEDGHAVIEVHDAATILRQLHYDSIYHEHLCYFSLKALSRLLAAHGLYARDVERSPISGGSWVVYCTRRRFPVTAAYTRALGQERACGVGRYAAWERFAGRCFEHRERTKNMIQSCAGKTIVGFGASARSATYLNFCRLTGRQISAVIDTNPLKQGLRTPGSRIPIVSLDEGLRVRPDLVYILAWNFAGEIVRLLRHSGYRGGYIVPFPGRPRIVRTVS